MKDKLTKQAEEAQSNKYASDVERNYNKVITLETLSKQLALTTGFSINRRDTEEVMMAINNFGYRVNMIYAPF